MENKLEVISRSRKEGRKCTIFKKKTFRRTNERTSSSVSLIFLSREQALFSLYIQRAVWQRSHRSDLSHQPGSFNVHNSRVRLPLWQARRSLPFFLSSSDLCGRVTSKSHPSSSRRHIMTQSIWVTRIKRRQSRLGHKRLFLLDRGQADLQSLDVQYCRFLFRKSVEVSKCNRVLVSLRRPTDRQTSEPSKAEKIGPICFHSQQDFSKGRKRQKNSYWQLKEGSK